MLRSMTGYGQYEKDADRYLVKAEFKSLNNKFLELNLRMPKSWQNKEAELRNMLTKLVERGSCQVNITLTYKNVEDKIIPMNNEVVSYYLDTFSKMGLSKEAASYNLMNIPNLFQPADEKQSEADYEQLKDAIHKAFKEFENFRITEGNMLSKELEAMTQKILDKVNELQAFDEERTQQVKARLEQELMQMKEASFDKNRLEQEIIYYIEKMDISEEKTRLIQHCHYFLETMKIKSSGKKLGFIAQEMGREINTLGAKANHFKIQQKVVEMKDELEKIKEQINNIL
jgi:uncharacterized protein (TIGR00255 family)